MECIWGGKQFKDELRKAIKGHCQRCGERRVGEIGSETSSHGSGQITVLFGNKIVLR